MQGPPEIDARALAPRVMRPDRSRFPVVRAAVEDIVDPREAWEALAARGFVPAAWAAGGPSRWFLTDRFELDRRGGPGETARCVDLRRDVWATDAPLTLARCVAVASDVRGVQAAEALAAEVAARLRAWGVPTPRATAWWFGRPAVDDPDPTDAPRIHARTLLDDAGLLDVPARRRWLDGLDVALGAGAPGCYRHLRRPLEGMRDWRAAAAAGLRARRDPRRTTPQGRLLRELASPFDPLFALWGLGYGLDAITDEAIVLVAPEAEDTVA